MLRRFILHPVTRRLLEHPLSDRFDSAGFVRELQASGLELLAEKDLWGSFAWFAAQAGLIRAFSSSGHSILSGTYPVGSQKRDIVTKIARIADCGNSPKNIFVEGLAIALATRDINSVLRSVTDDIQWNIIGSRLIRGKESLAEALREMQNDTATKLTVHNVVTHGKAGAVNGTLEFRSSSARGFCDVYEFSSAKSTSVNRITTFVIDQ